jgi:serine phosphatase RsbU (regulator of sigma subunit)
VRLSPGQRLLFYTDGATEATDADDDIYGGERLQSLLAAQHGMEPRAALEAILHDLRRWSGGGGLEDDVTMLIVDATDAPGSAG